MDTIPTPDYQSPSQLTLGERMLINAAGDPMPVPEYTAYSQLTLGERMLINAILQGGGGSGGGTLRRYEKYATGNNTNTYTISGIPSDAINFECYLNGLSQDAAEFSFNKAAGILTTNFGFIPSSADQITLVYYRSI